MQIVEVPGMDDMLVMHLSGMREHDEVACVAARQLGGGRLGDQWRAQSTNISKRACMPS